MVFYEDLLLNGNRLNNIHSLEGLKNLKSLQSLSLADNQLNTLPKTLGEIANLRSLSLENNGIPTKILNAKISNIFCRH